MKINVKVISKIEVIDRWLTKNGITHVYHKDYDVTGKRFLGESLTISDSSGRKRYHVYTNPMDSNTVILRKGGRRNPVTVELDKVSIDEFKEKMIEYFDQVNWPV